jgi:hypothetical protein
MNNKRPKAAPARHGEKMLEVKVRFFTNAISGKPGTVIPAHGMTKGFVRMDHNEAHGIRGGRPRPFNSLMEIPAAIEQVLIDNRVQLYAAAKTGKYIRERRKRSTR